MIRVAIIVVLVLAALATAVLWVDSYLTPKPPGWQDYRFRAELWELASRRYFPSAHVLISSRRVVEWPIADRGFLRIRTFSGILSVAYESAAGTGVLVSSTRHEFLGFRYVRRLKASTPGAGARPTAGSGAGVTWLRLIYVPFRFLLGLLLAYPAVAFIRGPLRRRARWKRGYCRRCGYNLTGLPEGKCPECGHEFDPQQRQWRRERFEKSVRRANQWRAKYEASRHRKMVTMLSAVGLLISLMLGGASYLRVSCQTPRLCCLVAWGELMLYYRPSLPDAGGAETQSGWGWSVAGFHDLSTTWWPWSFLRGGHGHALYVPLWIPALLFACAWGVLYRPWYRLRWRCRAETVIAI